MVISRRLCGLFLSLFLAYGAQAKPKVSVKIDPSVVQNGEDVVYSIIIENQGAMTVAEPIVPQMADWKVLNASRASNVSSQMINGRISSKYEFNFVYVLRALRTGKLTIPAFKIPLGSENRMTVPVEIEVHQLSAQGVPQGSGSDLDDMLGLPGLSGNLNDYPIPERESFFIRAEPSKTTVFEGELIVLSFVLYQKDVDLSNAELDRFPDFKGFLKEDLYIPKTWNRQQVILKGEPYFRTELLRYAIFTLKPGVEKIGQMVFRADARHSMSSIIGGLMTGKLPPNAGGGVIPSTKYSPEIKITSKPLPPTQLPSFTGGVGKFEMSVKGPQTEVMADSPVTIELTIRGRGNFKTIEAPTLNLPADFELVDVKNLYKFFPDANGYKTFEYLVVPKKAGTHELKGVEFSYFDPEEVKYKTLTSEPIQIKVLEANKVATGETPAQKEQAPTFGNIRQGKQTFSKIQDRYQGGVLIHPAFLIFQGFLYLSSFVWLFVRKRNRLRQAFLTASPWERTFETLQSKKQWPLFQLADLIDQWMRERLCGLIKSPDLYSESHNDDFIEKLKIKIHPEKQAVISELGTFWSDLDLLRFSGSQKQNEKTTYKPWYEKAKNLYDKIESVYGVGV